MKIKNYLKYPQRLRSTACEEPAHAEDTLFMKRCIALGQEAGDAGDIPVGALIVCDGKIIAESRNTREKSQRTLGHAELNVIAYANEVLKSWRLDRCTLYVTLEPCPMCAGAISAARIGRVVFGLRDSRSGAFGSVLNLNAYPLGVRTRLTAGVCDEECRALMQHFFSFLRDEKNEKTT